MIYNKKEIQELDRVQKLKIINSVTGIKPGNLIGTVNAEGQSNVAVFSSLVHLGSSPALLGFITRPQTAEVGHTLNNILENKEYTINHIHPEFIKNAHYTSAKFDVSISEFERCKLTEEYISGFKAPFVKESDGDIDLEATNSVGISGLNSYYSLKKIAKHPYVRIHEVPEF